MTGIRRRDLLTGTALVLVDEKLASAEIISGRAGTYRICS
jgi:hypothetical protein